MGRNNPHDLISTWLCCLIPIGRVSHLALIFLSFCARQTATPTQVQGIVYYKEKRDRDAIGLKHPAKQFSDDEGVRMTEEFIAGRRED